MTTTPKETGCLFNGDMVRAILDGRKTHTRRIVKFPKWMAPEGGTPREIPFQFDGYQDTVPVTAGHVESLCKSPYGDIGDLIYVRETLFVDDYRCDGVKPSKWPSDILPEAVYYRADGDCCQQIPECQCCTVGKPRWTPSILMPKRFARIWLEITGVRIERVQDISDDDVDAEGVYDRSGMHLPDCTYPTDANGCPECRCGDNSPQESFSELWQSLYGPESWERDWVWVYEFERVER